MGFFTGQVMRATGGKADPRVVAQLLGSRLGVEDGAQSSCRSAAQVSTATRASSRGGASPPRTLSAPMCRPQPSPHLASDHGEGHVEPQEFAPAPGDAAFTGGQGHVRTRELPADPRPEGVVVQGGLHVVPDDCPAHAPGHPLSHHPQREVVSRPAPEPFREGAGFCAQPHGVAPPEAFDLTRDRGHGVSLPERDQAGVGSAVSPAGPATRLGAPLIPACLPNHRL